MLLRQSFTITLLGFILLIVGCAPSRVRLVHRLDNIWVDTQENVVIAEYVRTPISESDALFALPHHAGVNVKYEELGRDVVIWQVRKGAADIIGNILSPSDGPLRSSYKRFAWRVQATRLFMKIFAFFCRSLAPVSALADQTASLPAVMKDRMNAVHNSQ